MYISQGQEQVDHITNEVKHNIEERCSTMKFGLDAMATGHCVTFNEHLEQNLENVRRETSRQRPMFCLITPTKTQLWSNGPLHLPGLNWSGPVCLIMIV